VVVLLGEVFLGVDEVLFVEVAPFFWSDKEYERKKNDIKRI
jgi:hypothetical protein